MQVTQIQLEDVRVKEGRASSCQVLPDSLCVSLHMQHPPVLSMQLGEPGFAKAAEAGGRAPAAPVSPAGSMQRLQPCLEVQFPPLFLCLPWDWGSERQQRFTPSQSYSSGT